MKSIVCEMCGSHDVIKKEGMYVCEHCGAKYSVDEAKKLMIEIEGPVDVSGSTVKVDTTNELENLYEIARRACDDNNSEKAAKYYDMILVKDPKSWEAQFYSVYYQTMECKIAEIPSASYTLSNSLQNVLKLIKEETTDQETQIQSISEIFSKCQSITIILFSATWKNYDPNGYNNNPAYYAEKSKPIVSIFTELRKSIKTNFGDDGKFGYLISEAMKDEIILEKQIAEKSATETDVQRINNLIDEVKKYDTSYSEEKVNLVKKGGCYIATAVYGSYDCPQVWTLRRYRDYALAKTWYGRSFIHIYYLVSPVLVKVFGNNKSFKHFGKKKLDKLVSKLNKNGFLDTPYNDIPW